MLDYCLKHKYWYVSKASRQGGEPCPKCVAARPPGPGSETIVIAGADPAKLNDYFAYADIEIKGGKARLLSVKEWLHKDYTEVVPQIAKRVEKIHARWLGLDTTGVGEPIKELLRMAGVRTMDIKFGEYVEWTDPFDGRHGQVGVKYAMVQYYRYCAQNGLLEIPRGGTEKLVLQLKQQEIIVGSDPEHHEDGRIKYGHPSGTHDDLAWAYLIALYVGRRWLTGGGGFVRPISELAAKKNPSVQL